jgi:hypothetical protein
MNISYGIGEMKKTYTVNPLTGRIYNQKSYDSSIPNLYNFLIFEEENDCLYFRILDKDHNKLALTIGFSEALSLVVL